MGRNLLQPNRPLRTRLRWQAETLGLRALLQLLRGRSHRTMQRGIRLGVRLARPLLAQRLTTASANLERVYGTQLSSLQRQRLAELSLQSFLLACLESIIQPVAESRIVVEGEGLAALLGQQKRGQGLIVASLHLGCWDIGLRWLSQHLANLAVVYRPANNPLTDPLLNRARSANSRCRWISRRDRWAMVRHLRQGGGLVLMSDLRGGRGDLKADFLGLETRFTRGPMALAQLAGVPLFPVAHVREDDGCFRLICGEPLQAEKREHLEQHNAEALARWQEPWIQAYAEQYYWIQRRWRRHEGARLRQLPPPAARVLNKLKP
jgi:lauroyl/myristoyl acyltransferase